jgi:hypothetical protein
MKHAYLSLLLIFSSINNACVPLVSSITNRYN